MKISKINNATFRIKKFVTSEQLKNIRGLAEKIDKESSVTGIDGTNAFNYSKIGYVEAKSNHDVFFMNTSKKISKIYMGNCALTIDRTSGEITESRKTLFTPIKCLLKKADSYFKVFNENFGNSDAVKIAYLKGCGFVDEIDGKAYFTSKKWYFS